MSDDKEHKVKVRELLEVFQHIQDHGDDSENGKVLGGVVANVGFDGYSVILTNLDGSVQITVLFHNKHHCQYDSDTLFEQFLQKIDAIYQHLSAE